MATRKIVEIDEEKCNGCGQCVPNCAEGALQIVDGKAKLVKDQYCDGLGACLGTCPQDAIRIIEREAEEFDEEAVEEHLAARENPSPKQQRAAGPPAGGGCPGAALMNFQRSTESPQQQPDPEGRPSALTQWPVQLMLVPAGAPFLDGADLLLAADCTPFALADFHERFLTGRKLLVGCPKLDDAPYYAEKLADILRRADIKSITILRMEVPCCSGLTAVARRAIEETNSDVPLREVVVGVRGQVIEDREHAGASTQG